MSIFNKFKTISTSIFSSLLVAGNIQAAPTSNDIACDNVLSCHDDPLEHETLSYKASKISNKAAKIDVSKIAQEAVYTCYNAYRPNFDWSVAKEKEKLAALGALDSSYLQIAVTQCAQSFATAIINQLSTISQKLGANDKNVFWNSSEQYVKQVLGGFCNEHGVKSTEYLNEQIANMIKMKKMFG